KQVIQPAQKTVSDDEEKSHTEFAARDEDGTRIGQAIGTPAYMAPEQARGEWHQVGPAADIFSLGAVLYELLTGRQPFQGNNIGEVLNNARSGNFARPRHRRSDVPRPLEAICLKAMAFDPKDRYLTAQGLADDVNRWVADEPVSCISEPWLV